jgi:hypothetical protein
MEDKIDELQQMVSELLEDVNTDEEFLSQMEAELRALFDEVYKELDQVKESLIQSQSAKQGS